jgi:hypothetical protein
MFAPEPGAEPAPQTPQAAAAEHAIADWLNRYLIPGAGPLAGNTN